jgi:hypothetical protein
VSTGLHGYQVRVGDEFRRALCERRRGAAHQPRRAEIRVARWS